MTGQWGSPKRRPWPFDAIIAGTGVMLGKPKGQPALVATKVQPFDQQHPTSFAYEDQPPYAERAEAYDDLTLGMGLHLQKGYGDRKYHYALNADLAIGGVWLKGPAITSVTPATTDSTNGVTRFFELGGNLYALVGRYVLKSTDGGASWATAKDFGAGHAGVDAVAFQYNGTGTPPITTIDYAFVALGDGEPMQWTSDGASWTQTFAQQVVTVSGAPTGGTFTLTYNGTAGTGTVAFNDTAANVQAHLRGIPALASVTVGGSAGGPWTVTFAGVGEPFLLALGTNSLTGGASPSVSASQTVTALAARALAVVGRDLWRARDTNMAAKCTGDVDPTVASNWGNANAFRVGDKTSAIVQMAPDPTGTLLLFKTDGVYTLDDSGEDHHLVPGLVVGGSGADDGRYWALFGNDVLVTYAHSTYRAKPTLLFGATHLTFDEMGPERLVGNGGPVVGRITAMQGDGGRRLYAGLYNDDTGDSYLVSFGAWVGPEVVEGQVDEAKRIDAWHGSLSPVFTGKKVQAMWRSPLGAPTGHARLHLGFSDGSFAHFTLPCVPNPAACSAYTFSTADGTVNLPLWHATFESDAKQLRSVDVVGLNLSATNTVQFQYKTDPSASAYTPLGASFAMVPWTRATFPSNTWSYLAELQVVLKSSDPASCPQVTAVVVRHNVRPALVREYAAAVLADNGLTKRDGRPVRMSASVLRQVVADAASAIGAVDVILPDESEKSLSFVDYGEALAWDERTRRWSASVSWKAVEFATITQYGTVGRTASYRVGDLSPFSVGQLATL